MLLLRGRNACSAMFRGVPIIVSVGIVCVEL
jgi:hypothetical protein